MNYDDKMQEVITLNRAYGIKPSLLLHSCCAVCASSVLERLADNFDVTVFYYNPNIMPIGEYEKRLNEQKRYCKAWNINMIIGEYDNPRFLEYVKGLENEPEGGARCRKCFELRLDKTAEFAKAGSFSYFCTTLTVSPHKNSDLINIVGNEIGEKYNIKFLPSDFKKREGFKRSMTLANEFGLYKQNYCGCRL